MALIRYIDVCSGISAPTMAWKPLGWEAVCFAEIEAAPRAVLAHHYHDTPLRGDFTEIEGTEYGPVDLLVGGTPCQSFSVAGLRGGLADGRGNLALEYLRLADRARPRWLVWENVPGVLSSNGGRDFGAILGGMGELGYGFAYRVLDAQHFGVPQRRRRVFVVGHIGDWRPAAAVLFERHSLQGNPPPRREKGPSVAALTANGVGTCGADDNQGQAGHLVAPTLNAAFGSKLGLDNQHIDSGAGLFVTHALRGEGFDASEDGTGRGTPLVPVCFSAKDHGADAGEIAPTLRAGGHSGSHANAGVMPAVAFQTSGYGAQVDEIASTMQASYDRLSNQVYGAIQGSAVRRLTPRECERLQGFPETIRTVRITVCEGAKSDHASSARLSSAAPSREKSAPVAARVLIDLEQLAVRLLRADGSSWSASGAEKPASSPLSMPADAFARLAAHTIISLVPVIRDGSAASLANITASTPHLSGSASASVSGPEIAALASDADKFTSEANRLTRFITSPVGLDTQACEQSLQTWSCCVLAAISGFIPAGTRSASSYTVEVEVRAGFTLVPYRNRMMADGPRYKMLGNSMAVPVVRWIGERIERVEALSEKEMAA